jgi:hypothetical protein
MASGEVERQGVRVNGNTSRLTRPAWAVVSMSLGLALSGAGCGSSPSTAIQAGAPSTSTTALTASTTSGTAVTGTAPAKWACASPSTFTPVPPPPGATGLPEVKSTATPREYADGEIGRFAIEPTVVEREQSAGSAVFDLVDERGMLVGEVTVTRRNDGRWILSALKSCRDLERPA